MYEIFCENKCWIINIVKFHKKRTQKTTGWEPQHCIHLRLKIETCCSTQTNSNRAHNWPGSSHTLLTWSRAPAGESCGGFGGLVQGSEQWKGRKGRLGVRSVIGEQLGLEMMERLWGGGGVMAPQPLCHMAPSQVQGEACWPLTGNKNREVQIMMYWQLLPLFCSIFCFSSAKCS